MRRAICIPCPRCTTRTGHYSDATRCEGKGTRYLIADGRPVPWSLLCRECCVRVLREIRSVAECRAENWTWAPVVEPEGCRVPAGATFLDRWPEPLENDATGGAK